MKTIWIVKGAVTDPEAHSYQAKLGDIEWQFSDGPPGERSSSADYLSLEAGIRAHAPAVFHFIGDEPETLWCESCGEAPVTQRLEFAGLCDGCAEDAEKEDRALEAQGPEGNGYDLPRLRPPRQRRPRGLPELRGGASMKPRTFTWAWESYASQPDPLMTPERALRLLRAWRSTSRKPTSMGGPLRRLERLGRGHYRVTDLRFGETATIAWECQP